MPTIENIQFVDFNDIYVIAVGVSMAYIVVESSQKTSPSFFSILSKITTLVKEQLLKNKRKIKEEEEAIITKIAYYLDTNLIKPETRGNLENTYGRAQKEFNRLTELENWINKILNFHTKTDFLYTISFDCFLYGLFILFIGAFENKEEICVDGLIQIMLIATGVLLAHCLCLEHFELNSWVKYLKPRIFTHGVLLAIALYIGICNYNCPIFPELSCSWLAIISVFACFIGFIAYLFTNILSNFILSVIIFCKSLSTGVSAEKAKEHREEIEKHQPELDKIDKELRESKLNITITNNTHVSTQK